MSGNVKRSQRTLLTSMILSAFAPFATGIAVILSNSITQVADFIRRTVEFLVLLLSWLVFRAIAKREDVTSDQQKRWENAVQYSVASALGFSGIIMLSLALFQGQGREPGGNVTFGLIITVLGFIVNTFFWRRYKHLGREGGGPIINAQRRLYLAKLVVDLAVIVVLATVAFRPEHGMTKYVDTLGSAVVSLYLLWSAVQTVREQRGLVLQD